MPSAVTSTPLPTPAARSACAPTGRWKLAAGRALSLHPGAASVLQIARGRAWVTLGGNGQASADHVLHSGETLALAAGQHVVLEPWPSADEPRGPLLFDWHAAAPAQAAATGCAADWESAIGQPLRELHQAVAQGGRAVGAAGTAAAGAAGRLALGAVRLALGRVTPAQPVPCGRRVA